MLQSVSTGMLPAKQQDVPHYLCARRVWLTVAVAVLAGCAADKGRPGGGGAVEASASDSAGVRIVVSSEEALTTSLPWRVDTVPELELGGSDSDVGSFHRIAGIAGLTEGGFVVLDASSRELRWFDAGGKHVRTIGGSGYGPSEFGNPILVPQFQADSLLIYDRLRSRFTWVAADGTGARTLVAGRSAFRGTPRAAAGSGALFISGSSSGACRENEGCQFPVYFSLVDVSGPILDTLAAHPSRWITYKESGQPPVFLHNELNVKSVAAAGPRGLVLEGYPRFELRQFGATGELLAIFRVNVARRQSSEDVLQEYLDGLPKPNRDGMARVYELMGLPEVVPAFQALKVDELGWYWAELFRVSPDSSGKWLVFDAEGRARGIIELPGGLEVHTIGRDYILGRWVDELGVEYVRRHSLRRTAF